MCRTFTFTFTMVLCLYSYAAGHIKMGVRRIPITENQAIVDRENCIWLVGWIDLLSVVGFIASQSDEWFLCLLISRLEL